MAQKLFKIAALAALGVTLILPAEGFITVSGGKFVNEQCQEFTWVGANMWRMLEAQNANPETIENVMRAAAERNITVMRIFAAGLDPQVALQQAPGQYNEAALRALDGVMAAAARHGLRVTLILARNWENPDSKALYASWSGLRSPDEFFTSENAQKSFQDHIRFMLTRENSVTGVRYMDDPTIFSWNLMNEPRFFPNNTVCQNAPERCTDAMQHWIETTSAYIKSVDPNHLVAIGSEGFWGTGSSNLGSNPSNGDWAAETGQNFVSNTQPKSIDYAVVHIWPDNWNISTDFIHGWIDAHMADARAMNKPLVIEEFGKNVSSHDEIASARDPVFQAVFSKLNDSLAQDDVLKGAQYWMWDPLLEGPQSANWTEFGQDQVLLSDSTMTNIIVPTAKAAAARRPPVAGCSAQTSGVAAAASIPGGGRKLLMGK